MFFTTDTLLTSIQTRTLAPLSQVTFQNSDIIRFANEEMMLKVVPDIMSVREDFFLRKTTISIVANQSRYTIPERAIGNNFKDILYTDTGGNSFSIPKINVQDLPINAIADLYPNHFYLLGDQIVLSPKPTSSQGSITLYWYMRPSDLVLTASCAKITLVSRGATQTTYTVDTDLTASLAAGNNIDFLSGVSPFQLWAYDVAIQSITSTQIITNNSDTDNEPATAAAPQVGDYICPSKSANIPMIPEELHPLLAEYSAARMIQALGQAEKMQIIMANLAEMRQKALLLICNRPENKGEKIVNRFGFSRSSGFGWWRSFR